MLGTLENSFHVPSYLLQILRDYLKDRSLPYETLEVQRIMEITSGVAQESILGLELWNASYNSLLRLDMPEESRLVGYADDVVVLVAGTTVEQAQSRLGLLMRQVSDWMTAHGFSLALDKNRSSHLENPDPASHIGSKMSFFEQIKAAADRAAAGGLFLVRRGLNSTGGGTGW